MGLLNGDLDHDVSDAGCDLAAKCLECPFERCLQEEPRGRQRYLRAQRDALAAELSRQGYGSRQIATRLGVSQRTVQRSLARTRDKQKTGRERSLPYPLSPGGRGLG